MTVNSYVKARVASVSAILAVSSTCSLAIDFTWTGAGGDYKWNNPVNWSTGGVESAEAPINATNTVTVFNTGAVEPWTVKFESGVTNGALKIQNDNIVFDLLGNTCAFVTPYQYITSGSGQTGSLKVVNGTLEAHRNLDTTGNNPYSYIGMGKSSLGRLTISGTGAVYRGETRTHFGQDGGTGELLVEDGGTVGFWGSAVFYTGNSGVGRVVVTNANLMYGVYVGIGKGSYGEALLTGSNAVWDIRNARVKVGASGSGTLTVNPGVTIVPDPAYARVFMTIAESNSSTGTVTFAGSTISKDDGAAALMQLSLGSATHIKPGVSLPDGGVGTLNLLDGTLVKGTGTSAGNTVYLYVAPGCRIRIRDSELNWCSGSYKNQPFFFREGSFLTVELTDETSAFSRETPLMFSGATAAGMSTNIISDAILELVLTDSYRHRAGDEFRIMRYDGSLQGEFAGLPDGGDFYVDNHRFMIDYGAGDASEIVVTAKPPQGTVLLIK